MNCPTCGRVIPDESSTCPYCGTAFYQDVPAKTMPTAYSQPPAPASYQQQPTLYQGSGFQPFISADQLPLQFKPLGAWAYFGYSILFSIPLIGFILLIVFSVNDTNINRRNYARSFFCQLALAVIVVMFVVLLLGGTGALSAILGNQGLFYRMF